MNKLHAKKLGAAALVALTLICAGCDKNQEAADDQIAVELARPEQGVLTLEGRFVGSVSSGEDVSVIPLVSGEITDVYVQVGDTVTAGQALAQIDDTTARLQLNSAQAAYDSAVAAARQTTGASWDMQSLSTQSSINQLESAINSYYQQIEAAERAMADLSDQIDELKRQKADLQAQGDDISDGLAQAQAAMTAAQTKYYAALAMKAQLDSYGIATAADLAVLAANPLTMEAAAAINQALAEQGLTLADCSDAGIQLLKSVYDEASAAYSSLVSGSSTVSGGVSTIDAAIAQCEAGIDQYKAAIDQYLAAIQTYQQNLEVAKRSQVLTETQLRQETEAVLDSQIAAAGVGVASAREALDYYRLTAPIAGTVTAVSVSKYGMSAPGYAAFTISDQDAMTVTFSVSQAVRDNLRLGQSVAVAAGDRQLSGAIVEIAYTASPYSGLFPIKVSVAGARNQLLAGTTVSVTTATYSSAYGSLLVPYDAVYYDDNQAYVFCEVEGIARRVDVSVGLYDETTAAIIGGLLAQDKVIVSWSPRLRDGAAVRAVNALAEDGMQTENDTYAGDAPGAENGTSSDNETGANDDTGADDGDAVAQ